MVYAYRGKFLYQMAEIAFHSTIELIAGIGFAASSGIDIVSWPGNSSWFPCADNQIPVRYCRSEHDYASTETICFEFLAGVDSL